MWVMDLIDEVEEILLDLLEEIYFKSTEHLVEELKMEYPAYYQKIMEVFGRQYGLSGCGKKMSPVTAAGIALSRLLKAGKVITKTEQGTSFWCLSQRYNN